MEHHPEAIHFYHSLGWSPVLRHPRTYGADATKKPLVGALDAFSFAHGTQVDHPTPAFARLILLAIYPSPWEEIKLALEQLVSTTGRGISEERIVGGKMGLRLIWQALSRATGIVGQWDEVSVCVFVDRWDLGAHVIERKRTTSRIGAEGSRRRSTLGCEGALPRKRL